MHLSHRHAMRFAALAPTICAAALLCACKPSPSADSPDGGAGAASSQPPPAPSRPGEGTLRKLGDGERVALNGPRVEARPGDWVLESDGKVAVVDARGGRILDFGIAGGDDALVLFEPEVATGMDDDDAEVVSMGPAGDGVLRVERRVANEPLTLWTFVSFAAGTLRVESFAASRAEKPSRAVTVGEIVQWGNVPTWVEGTGFLTAGGEYAGDFLAREGLGVAYALGREGGRIGARFHDPAPGFHERPHTGEHTQIVAPGGATPRRAVRLAVAAGHTGAAVAALMRAEGLPLARAAAPGDAVPGETVEARRCPGPLAPDGLPFARFEPAAVDLPPECFELRRVAPGYEAGPWTPSADFARAAAPSSRAASSTRPTSRRSPSTPAPRRPSPRASRAPSTRAAGSPPTSTSTPSPPPTRRRSCPTACARSPRPASR